MTARPMTEGLEPCPFAVGDRTHKARVRDNGRDGCGPADTWWAQCKCGAEGPNARSPEEAGLLWNRRSTSAAVRGMREALREGFEHMGDLDALQNWLVNKVAPALDALSGIEGEDKQARPSGSEPISTDTKGTTK